MGFSAFFSINIFEYHIYIYELTLGKGLILVCVKPSTPFLSVKVSFFPILWFFWGGGCWGGRGDQEEK